MKTENILRWNGNIVGYEAEIDSRFNSIRRPENSSGVKRYVKSKSTELCYDSRTSKEVIEVLERCYDSGERLVFDFGDAVTGQSWGEINDISGRIGKSTGVIKIPLLIYNSRSLGGGSLLDHCIVKITTSKGGRILYQHPNYKPAN